MQDHFVTIDHSEDVVRIFPKIKRHHPYQKKFALYSYQNGIIHALVDEGRDVLAVIPTGMGKSICYQYAAAKLPGLTIVVEPTTALLRNQVDSIRKSGNKIRAFWVTRRSLEKRMKF